MPISWVMKSMIGTEETMAEKAALVSFGLGGHGVDFYPKPDATGFSSARLSGYEDPESFSKRLAKGAEVEDYEGAVVLDKRAILRRNPGYAVASPLVDLRLQDGEVDECPEPSGPLASALKRNEWGALLASHKRAKRAHPGLAGPLDSVSLNDFVAWWRLRGARVGRVTGGTIVWDPEPEPRTVKPQGAQRSLFGGTDGKED